MQLKMKEKYRRLNKIGRSTDCLEKDEIVYGAKFSKRIKKHEISMIKKPKIALKTIEGETCDKIRYEADNIQLKIELKSKLSSRLTK